jgi:hypothetical protein
MSFRLVTAAAAAIVVGTVAISSQALALGIGGLGVTTQDCLDKGQCAYVSPKGRVTCGKCPGQLIGGGWTLAVPAGVTALCADNNWSVANPSRACFSRGGAKVLVRP